METTSVLRPRLGAGSREQQKPPEAAATASESAGTAGAAVLLRDRPSRELGRGSGNLLEILLLSWIFHSYFAVVVVTMNQNKYICLCVALFFLRWLEKPSVTPFIPEGGQNGTKH